MLVESQQLQCVCGITAYMLCVVCQSSGLLRQHGCETAFAFCSGMPFFFCFSLFFFVFPVFGDQLRGLVVVNQSHPSANTMRPPKKLRRSSASVAVPFPWLSGTFCALHGCIIAKSKMHCNVVDARFASNETMVVATLLPPPTEDHDANHRNGEVQEVLREEPLKRQINESMNQPINESMNPSQQRTSESVSR